MNPKLQALQTALVNAIAQVFNGAAAVEQSAVVPVTDTNTRVAPLQMISSEIYDALREMNQAAYKISDTGEVYIDWEMYLNLFDVYYDNGDLFAVCTRGGKLYRIPVTVTPGDPNNSEGDTADQITLGAMVEIPLTGRAAPSTFRVVRATSPDGSINYKWFAIACSSVLNRVNEIDSRALFDSFVANAERTAQYPILSFYHEADAVRWGRATGLARDGDLYLAWGDWFDTPAAQRAAETLEKSTENWGTSIGYTSTKPPEWLELDKVRIPVFTEGVNPEISIVLEREAAAYHTAFVGTQEVTRMLKTDLAYIRMAQAMGEEYANQFLDETNGAQRAINADPNTITRQVAAETVSEVMSAAVAQVATPTPAPAPVARELILDDETLTALVNALAVKLPFAALQSAVEQQAAKVDALAPRLETLEAATRTAQTRTDERLAGLEQDDATKRALWQQDLPARAQTTVVLKPREIRAQAAAIAEPDTNSGAAIAQSTLAKMKSAHANTRQ